MRKPTFAPDDENGHGLPAPEAPTPVPSWAAGLASSLREVAGLHAAMADAYGDLAQDVEKALAALADRSVHASVPLTTKLLTATDVAKLLGVHGRTLRRMELAGEIPPAIGEGKAKRWRRADFERWEGGRQ